MAKVILEKENLEREEFLRLLVGVKWPEGRRQRDYSPEERAILFPVDPTSDSPETPDRPESPNAPSGGDTQAPRPPMPRPRLEPGMA
jgi:Tfp pilus assembly protein FimV